MDQDAFRNLLAAPSRPGTGRAAGVLGAPMLKRGHGGGKAKDLAPKKDEKPAFAPRKTFKKDSKYQDRAEMRRLGVDDEYKPVEQLLEDFEKRAAEEGETEESIEEKRRYLGGTATHSVLIKGLDYALLAARKAELDAKDSREFDEALDEVLEGGAGAAAEEEGGRGEGKGKEVVGKGTGKLSRDDLVKELKRKRELAEKYGVPGSKGEEEDEDIMGVGSSKKYKTSVAAVEEPKVASLGSKFKSIAQKKAEAQAAEDAKTKKKKKKKKVLPTAATASIEETPPAPLDTSEIKPLEPVASSSTPPAAKVVEKEESPEIEDIFGGVGEYEANIPSDSSGDEDGEITSRPARVEKPAAVSVPQKSRGKWFDDGEDDSPGPLASSSKIPLDNPRNRSRSRSGSFSRSPSPSLPTTRLIGLSSSALPSASELLAADKAAEAAEKRREKKAKWRAKQGLSRQDDGGEDEDEDGGGGWRGKEERDGGGKDNREAQRLTAYMAKKEKKV